MIDLKKYEKGGSDLTLATVGKRYQVIILLKERQKLKIKPNTKVEVVVEGRSTGYLSPFNIPPARYRTRAGRRGGPNGLCEQTSEVMGEKILNSVMDLEGVRALFLKP